MKIILILSLLLLSGCSASLVTHKEQLMLNVPTELLEQPQPLNKL